MTLTLATLLTFLAPTVVFIALCVRIYRQLTAFRRVLPPPPDWTADVSVDRYGPMSRLLADEDIRFLDGLDTVVAEGEIVSLVPAVAGG